MAWRPLPCPRLGEPAMSGPVEQHRGLLEGGAPPGTDEDARHQLEALRAEVERLMRERATPALAGPADQAERFPGEAPGGVAHRSGAAPTVDDAIDELMSGFDVRLAEVNRRLDRVLERRR